MLLHRSRGDHQAFGETVDQQARGCSRDRAAPVGFLLKNAPVAKGQKCLTKSVSQGSDKRHVTISCTEHDDHGDHYRAPLGAGIDERRYILHLSIPKP
jgi:hypothetical protein